MPVVVKPELFSPKMVSSRSLAVSVEQQDYIRNILDVVCSDSRFAEKAYVAIWLVLTAGTPPLPTVSSLNPSSATIGDASFTLQVIGTNFNSASQIIWNGSAEPTTFVSATQLTTEVDMTTAVTPTTIPVAVENDGIRSDPKTFTLNEAPLADSFSTKSVKEEKKDIIVEKKLEDKKEYHTEHIGPEKKDVKK